MSDKSSQVISKYKYATGLDNIRLAKLFGVDRRSIGKYLMGATVHPKVALRIEEVTHGSIKALDLIDPNSLPGKKFFKKK